MLWTLPSQIVLMSGVGAGSSELNAFDAALMNAGIGDFNLIRVSSILPAGCKVYNSRDDKTPFLARLPFGSLLPTVYGVMKSDKPGDLIAVAVGVGIPLDGKRAGAIFEAGIHGSKHDAENLINGMLAEAMLLRGINDYDIAVTSSQLLVSHGIGCVLSAAVMFRFLEDRAT